MKNLIKPLIAIVISLLVGALLILPTKTTPLEAYMALLQGAFRDRNAIFQTLSNATPLIFMGLAASISFRSGIWNIGLEGQMYWGAFVSALIGIYGASLPSFILIPLCLIGAFVAGGLWSLFPAFLKERYNTNIVITTIMMNNVAQLLTNYLASYPFKGDVPISATYQVDSNAQLPRIVSNSTLNIGFLLALVVAAILFFVLFKTQLGYKIRAFGQNESFAATIGIDKRKMTYLIMLLSAGIAGLAGAEQTLGVNGRFIADFSPGYGFNGITVAYLGLLNPIGAIIGGLFFGALTSGSIYMEIMTSVTRDLISSIQAVIIMFLAADQLIKFKKRRVIRKEGS